MGFWGALFVFAALGSTPAADAPEPRPLPTDRDDAAADEGPDAAAKRAAQRDAGLRPVRFRAEPVHASSRAVISPDLRDPFLVARRTDERPPARRERRELHDDLRDPFASHRHGTRTPSPPADLRDPFHAAPDAPECSATTDDGVKIQRPKSMHKPGCAAAIAPQTPSLTRYG